MYEQYADDIYRYLYSRTRDEQLSKDLTADTFARGWTRINAFDFKQPRPWLYTIARNVLTDHWRKKQTLPLEEADAVQATGESPEDQMDAQLATTSINNALDQLPDPMRDVIIMRFILGYSARQTAQNLDLSESNIRVIQYRALKKLKELMS